MGLVNEFCERIEPDIVCFLRKLCQKRSFFDILDRKQGFKDQNTEVLNRAKKWTFSRRVSQWIMS